MMNNQDARNNRQFQPVPTAVQQTQHTNMQDQPGQAQSPVPQSPVWPGSGFNQGQPASTQFNPPPQRVHPGSIWSPAGYTAQTTPQSEEQTSKRWQNDAAASQTHWWHKRRRLALFSVLCLILLLGAAGAAFLYSALNATPDVTLYRVSMKTVNQEVGGGGIAFPQQRLDISYPFSALVQAVYVKPGDKVTPNQPLVHIDLSQVNAQNAVQLQPRSGGDAPAQPNGNIVSAIAGVVTFVNVYPGQVFPANKVMLTIYDEANIIVHVSFPLASYGQIHVNQQVQVMPSALPDLSLSGIVTSIIFSADSQAGTFEVWVTVPNASGQLLPGMSIFVQVQNPVQGLAVPRLAVLNPDLDSIVFVVRGQHAYIQHVKVAENAGDTLLIGSGLQVNDLIVLVGLDSLRDGQAVHIMNIES